MPRPLQEAHLIRPLASQSRQGTRPVPPQLLQLTSLLPRQTGQVIVVLPLPLQSGQVPDSWPSPLQRLQGAGVTVGLRVAIRLGVAVGLGVAVALAVAAGAVVATMASAPRPCSSSSFMMAVLSTVRVMARCSTSLFSHQLFIASWQLSFSAGDTASADTMPCRW